MVCCVDSYKRKCFVLYVAYFGKLKYLYFYATVCELPSKLNRVNGVHELRKKSLANGNATTFYTTM